MCTCVPSLRHGQGKKDDGTVCSASFDPIFVVPHMYGRATDGYHLYSRYDSSTSTNENGMVSEDPKLISSTDSIGMKLAFCDHPRVGRP